ncbi:MAG: TrmB family transcriptional regulator [Planctomycetes bacterium]|nr:TrmB family transcriptional regulator [Planctomycetota bacterium]
MNAFVDFGIADADLTPAEALVWFVLFRDTKGTGTARTAQADIARRAGLSVRGVKLALRNLRAKGMVQVVRRGQLTTGPSVYRVHPTRHMG